MAGKNICLISRSIYPHPISHHTQNMQTFEGWLRLWDNIVIVSQCRFSKLNTSQYKDNIYGVLLPLMTNKYFNVIYFTLFGLFRIRQLSKKYDFDIYQASDAGGAILALIASRLYGKKFVFEVQGDIFDYPSHVGGRMHSSLVQFFSEVIVKKADYIRIVSPFLYHPLDRFGIDRNKVFLVPPRCNSILFNKKNVVGEKEDYYKSKYNLLFVGNLLVAKGVDILLEAFALINKENQDIGLTFVGDGEERDRLVSRSIELGIQDRVSFLGKIEYESIPNMMYYADVLVLPSIEEGVGRVLLEAMAMNLPIVASNVGGIPLVIDDGRDGLLFEVGDIEGLKDKVLLLLNDASFSKEMTKIAHQKFLENYEYEVSMKMFLNMYKSILKT